MDSTKAIAKFQLINSVSPRFEDKVFQSNNEREEVLD